MATQSPNVDPEQWVGFWHVGGPNPINNANVRIKATGTTDSPLVTGDWIWQGTHYQFTDVELWDSLNGSILSANVVSAQDPNARLWSVLLCIPNGSAGDFWNGVAWPYGKDGGFIWNAKREASRTA